MVQKVLVKRQAEALALQPAGGLLLRHIISQMTLYLCWHGICGAVTLNPAEWKNHKHPTLLQDVSMCVCIKHSKVLNFKTAYFPLPSFLSSLFFFIPAGHPNKEWNLGKSVFYWWLTRPAAGWHSSGVALRWGQRGGLDGNTAQTAASFVIWCSLVPAVCCWLHGPSCCGRRWALTGRDNELRSSNRELAKVWTRYLKKYLTNGGRLDKLQ